MKHNIFAGFRNLLRRYAQGTSGATLVAFALTMPVVIGAMGMSVDLSRTYLAQSRLSHALDAAALAGAGSANLTTAQLNARVNAYFKKNYATGGVGEPGDAVITYDGTTLKVSATVHVDTTFLQVLGISEASVKSHSVVQREVRGIEVALVLDVTGSMSTNNNIAALRTASANFVDIMCPQTNCSNRVKIGIVPFSASVNVGPYGLGKTPGGATYDTAFVNNPKGYTFNQSQSKQWWGCILERASPQDTQDATSSWRWEMFRYVSNSGDTSTPNTNCNKAYVQPLTDVKSTLKSRITALQASGNTLSNVGMVWGYRVLSPEFPFREGSAFSDPDIRKVALLMTDGDNNIGGVYSAYGPWATLKLTDHDLDVKLAATCQNMKNQGITIYTVTFTSAIDNTTKGYFRNCATDVNKYIDAPTQEDLKAAFNKIAAELSNLYVSE